MAQVPLQQQLDRLERLAERTRWEASGTIPIPVFDEGKESFLSFVRKLNDYLNIREATMDEAYRVLPICLRGASREAYDALPLAVQFGDWQTLLRAVQRGVYTDEKRQQAQTQLAAEKQGNRSVEAFAKACRELGLKSYPEDEAAAEAVVRSTFLTGLKPEIRSHVRRLRPQTFAEAKQAAIHEEAIRKLDANDEVNLKEVITHLTDEIHYMNFNRDDNRSSYPNSHNNRDSRFPSQEFNRSNRSRGSHSQERNNYRSTSPFRGGSNGNNFNNNSFNHHNNNGGHRGNGSFRGGQQNNRGRGGRRNGRYRNNNGGNQGFNGGYGNNNNNGYYQPQVNAIFDPMTAPSSGSSTLSSKATFITLCTIIAAFIIPVSAATPLTVNQTYYFCQQNRGGILVVPPKPEKCATPTAENITTTTATMYIRNHTLGEHPAYKCTVRRFKDCTSSTVFFSRYNWTFEGYETPTVTECWDAVNEKSWTKNGEPLRKTFPHVYETKRKGVNPSPIFWGDRCETTWTFKMEKGTFASIADDVVITALMLNTNECKSHQGECRSNNSIVVWEVPKKPDPCNFVKVGEYEANVGGDTLVIESIESAFIIENATVSHNISKCFSERVYKTKSGAFFTLQELTEKAAEESVTADPLPEPSLNRTRRNLSADHLEYHPESVSIQTTPPPEKKKEFSALFRRMMVFPMKVLELASGHFTDTIGAELIRWGNRSQDVEHFTKGAYSLSGELIKAYDVRYMDVVRSVERFNCYSKEMHILSTIALHETILTTYAAVNDVEEEELHRLLRSCTAKWTGKSRKENLPVRERRNLNILAVQCALHSIGKGSTHPEVELFKLTSDTIRRACPIRTGHYTRNETYLSDIKRTIRLMEATFKARAPLAYYYYVLESGSQALHVTDWYRSLVQFWDMLDRPPTEYPSKATEAPVETTRSTTTSAASRPTSTSSTSTTTTTAPITVSTTASRTVHPAAFVPAPPVLRVQTTTFRHTRSSDPSPKNSVGTLEHVQYMQKTYDDAENIRRKLTATHLNNKLQYTAEKLQADMKRNFNRVFDHICQAQNRQLEIWWALLHIDPSIGMRTIMQREDIGAAFVGNQVLAVNQCQKITVQKIYVEHRVNGTCFVHTPVITESGEQLYIIPGTRDLMVSSPTTDCNIVRRYIWVDDKGEWVSSNGKANVTNMPNLGHPTGAQLQRLTFTGEDPYSEVKGSSFPLMLAISYGANLVALQQRQDSLLRILSGRGILDGDFADIKNAGKYMLEDAVSTVSDAIGSITDQYWSLVMWIGLPTIGIAALIIIAIIAAKILFFRAAATNILEALAINAVEEEGTEMTPLQVTAPKPSAPAEDPEPVYYRRNYPPLFTILPILIPMICTVDATVDAQENVNTTATGLSIPYIRISLADRGIVALWDTGASISYIPEATANYIGMNPQAMKIARAAKTADGSSVQFIGTITTKVRIANYTFEHTFLVSRDGHCPAHALLGMDFMNILDNHGIATSLKPKDRRLIIGDSSIELVRPGEEAYKTTEDSIDVVTAREVILEPNQPTLIRIKTTHEIGDTRALLLQPNRQSPLNFGKTVFHPLDSTETSVCAVNTTDSVIRLTEGELLGAARILSLEEEPDQPCEPHVPEEARWEEQLPEFPAEDFMKDLNLEGSDLTKKQKRNLETIIRRRKEAFFNEDGKIGHFRGNKQVLDPMEQGIFEPYNRRQPPYTLMPQILSY